jgi:hypothetical protein
VVLDEHQTGELKGQDITKLFSCSGEGTVQPAIVPFDCTRRAKTELEMII